MKLLFYLVSCGNHLLGFLRWNFVYRMWEGEIKYINFTIYVKLITSLSLSHIGRYILYFGIFRINFILYNKMDFSREFDIYFIIHI